MRPWLIIERRVNGVFGCFPISGQCYDGSCFEIVSSHADFAATGLKKSCFIHDSHIFELPGDVFATRRGRLAGVLLAEFRDFSGL